MRDQLTSLMAERRADDYAGPRDLLWRIAHATDRDTGQRLPLEEARDEAASQLAAGDATIGALTWIWYLLALHPEVEARLHAELDAVLGNSPIHDHLRKLVYTRQVLDEVLRLYPPVPITPRQARKRDVICGHKIPRGAVIVISPWVVHRHRKLWSEPETFDPDRFLDERSRDRPRFAYIPFIVGPGADTILIHAEAGPHLHRSLMTVNPGFGGQSHPRLHRKVRAVRAMIAGRDIAIEVDGGINAKTAPKVVAAGATRLVAGSAVFRDGPAGYARNIEAIQNAAMSARGDVV